MVVQAWVEDTATNWEGHGFSCIEERHHELLLEPFDATTLTA